MDINRNHYFIAGLLLFLAGFQFRYVTSFVLNEKASQIVESRFPRPTVMQSRSFLSFSNPMPFDDRRTIQPPRWLGWSLISIGGVLFAFSLTMKRPGT